MEDAVGQQRRQGRRRLHAHGDDLSTCAARALSARTPRPWQHAGGQAATPSRADPKLLCCCNRKPAPQCCEARLPARTQARTRRRPRGSTTSVADSACMGRPHASWLHSCVTSLRRQTVSVYSHRRRRSRQLKTSRSPASKLAHQPVPCGAQTGQLWQVLTCSDAHPGTDAHECLRWAGYDRSCGTPQDPGASRSNRAPARGARGAQSQPARAAPAPTQRPRRPRTARCRAAARPGPCSPLPARRRWPPAPGAIGRCAHARLIHAARQHLAQQQTRRGGASTGAQHCMSAAEPRMPDLL